MPSRVAEHLARKRPFGRAVRYRVELHGVSMITGDDRVALRWEWIESISVEDGAAVVRGGDREIAFPPSAFGVGAEALAEHLQAARSIERRADVIGELGGGAASPD